MKLHFEPDALGRLLSDTRKVCSLLESWKNDRQLFLPSSESVKASVHRMEP